MENEEQKLPSRKTILIHMPGATKKVDIYREELIFELMWIMKEKGGKIVWLERERKTEVGRERGRHTERKNDSPY